MMTRIDHLNEELDALKKQRESINVIALSLNSARYEGDARLFKLTDLARSDKDINYLNKRIVDTISEIGEIECS